MRVWGRAPDHLTWEVGGQTWRDGRFGDDPAPPPPPEVKAPQVL